MSDDPERVTVLARSFHTAALEYHRGRMAEKGYVIEGTVTPGQFRFVDEEKPSEDLYDGETLFAITFRKKTQLKDAS